MDSIIETEIYGEDIIRLWQEAFGDSREDILFFLNNAKNKRCLCLYSCDKLCSMLFLVDCTVNGEGYKYIYAACTDRKCRGEGHMSALLEYSCTHYKNVLLIPADSDLVNYYSKRNFNHKLNINDILFNECTEIKEYLFEGCSLKEPFALAYKGE